ncbi:MAG TPA: hypothetical protein VHO29_13040 [Marmoricola sp.]|nr:hypothetical protein [Marmoricola sp.]
MSIASASPALLDAALVDALDAQVRAAVRRDGVDPQSEVHLVRSIAEQVVRAHDERSLTGAVTPVPDVTGVVGELVARVSGFGALQPYLDDPEVEKNCTFPPTRPTSAVGPDRPEFPKLGSVCLADQPVGDFTNSPINAASADEKIVTATAGLVLSLASRMDHRTPTSDPINIATKPPTSMCHSTATAGAGGCGAAAAADFAAALAVTEFGVLALRAFEGTCNCSFDVLFQQTPGVAPLHLDTVSASP